jgi:hypothetical protein
MCAGERGRWVKKVGIMPCLTDSHDPLAFQPLPAPPLAPLPPWVRFSLGEPMNKRLPLSESQLLGARLGVMPLYAVWGALGAGDALTNRKLRLLSIS